MVEEVKLVLALWTLSVLSLSVLDVCLDVVNDNLAVSVCGDLVFAHWVELVGVLPQTIDWVQLAWTKLVCEVTH